MSLTALCEDLERFTDAELRQLDPALQKEIATLLGIAANDKTDKAIHAPVSSFERGPLLWLTKYTRTEDAQKKDAGLPFINPFPQKSYFGPLFDALINEKRMFVPKSRDMMTSFSAMGYATWRAQWWAWDCYVQTLSLDKAAEMINYASQFYRHQPEWLRAAHPLTTKEPLTYEMTWTNGGRVKAIPGGIDKVRTFKPNWFFMDEAAFMAEAEQSWNAAMASSSFVQMLAVSSANPGWMADECSMPG